ncbi:hypothetical protein U8527_13235 [Kordia algicida OT-1]|uniref:Uncharacterized protein n=1 Tax=Kordia algicida OT-1 TaxID=391587 RepID=A9E5F3_9FLAO|nr:hypothetical protein [Kordia algicida]EDP95174.1 hypothetical protein KAOT1_06812 [Kordia algicida OT-1]
MNLELIKSRLQTENSFFSEDAILHQPTVIGYDKQFRWSWFATQMNTFIVATDVKEETITVQTIEAHLKEAFEYSSKNYSGWPRGLQSGVGVISILISENITEEAKVYCKKLKSGKKWAAFTIPVVIDATTKEAFYFDKNPMWGRIYYPFFKRMIQKLTSSA